MSETKNREYSLDFLKIAGTVLIMLHHYQGAFGVQFGPVNFATGKFYFGYIVELFFMLSGYFAASYISKIKGGLSFRDYFLKRVMRLVPLMFISTFVCTVSYAILWKGNGIELWKTVVTAFGVQSGGMFNEIFVNSHFWYLSVLIICYALFFLATKLSDMKGFDCSYAYIALIIAGVSAISYSINLPFMNGSVARGYIAFFTGTLISLSLYGKTLNNKTALICVSIVLAGIILIIFKWDWVSYGINYFLCFFFYPALIILFKTPLLDRVLNHKILGVLAAISFNAYIWHLEFNFISQSVFSLLGVSVDYSNIITEVAYIIVEFGIGALSYYLIEKPVNAKLRRVFFAKTGELLK